MCTKITEAWNEIDEHGNWDDLMEHDPNDLKNKFDVSEEDADILWMVIQSRVDPSRDPYRTDAVVFGQSFLTTIHEALHQSLDGWTEEQGLIIQAFLSDITYAVNQIAMGEKATESYEQEKRS